MKKRKIFLLLVLTVCFLTLFTACGVSGKNSSFWAVKYDDLPVYDEVSKLEGELFDYDNEHNLIVMRETDLDNENYVVEKYTVYDLNAENEIIFRRESKTLYQEPNNLKETSVTLNYPMIVVTEKRYNEESTDAYGNPVGTTYHTELFIAEKDGAQISGYVDGLEASDVSVNHVANLYACTDSVSQKTYWIDSNLNLLRTESSLAVSSYNPRYFSEYNGYLYSNDDSTVTVYAHNGAPCAVYNAPTDIYVDTLEAFVLNNGNVLIQQYALLRPDAENYTVMIYGDKYAVTTLIMNYQTGETTPVKFDFIIDELQSAYLEGTYVDNDDFPLVLKEGTQNQAYVYAIVNKVVQDMSPLYIALDNNANVKGTFTVELENVDWERSYVFSENLMMAAENFSGGTQYYLVNVKTGKVVSPITRDASLMNGHIVTYNGVYDMNMKLVYDFTEKNYTTDIESDGKNLFAWVYNSVTDAYESYLFNFKTHEFELMFNGYEKDDFDGANYGVYYTFDYENDILTVYNINKEVVFVSDDNNYDIEYLDDILCVEIYNGHDTAVYVIK